MAIERFEARLIESKYIANNVKHLVFEKYNGSKFNFIPGQFITFLFNNDGNKVKRRSYSIASISERTSFIEIAISYINGGIASENLFNMQVGKTFHAMGPAGRLILKDKEKIRKLVLVGTGTGIVPYRSMLSSLEQKILNDEIQEVYILLGVQNRSDIIYAEDFRQYSKKTANKISFISCLSRQQGNLMHNERIGYVQNHFHNLKLDPKVDIVYLCGNPNMVNDASYVLNQKGFDLKAVRREKYISSN